MKALTVVALSLLILSPALATEAPAVVTAYGPVTGLSQDGVRIFKGIPFAAPPVGELRWRPPVPPQPWTTPRDATHFGPACPQRPDKIVRLEGEQSEDCLYLNVWTPENAKALPVMVFIHGGGFRSGAGSGTLYDSPALAQHGVVLVTINYRLGNFGFLCHPALAAESPQHTCGNYGLLDQIMALHWVHDNIASFGGDPTRVTIFGESAGAVSVALLMTSPLAQGLFQRAIIESGSVPARLKTAQELQAKGLQLQHEQGIADGPPALAQLRKLPAEKLLVSGAGEDRLPGASLSELPCMDGYVITEQPSAVFAAGRQANVPLIAGSNADEGTLWSRRLPIKTVEQFRTGLQALLGQYAAEAELLYPCNADADVQQALDEVVGEAFVAGARRAARWQSPKQPDVYLYHFTHANRLLKATGLGACHGCELPYVFGKLPQRLPVAPEERQLSELVMGYWTRFAATGNPNAATDPQWPRYSHAADQHLTLDVPPQAGAHLRQSQCDFWDKVQGLAD